MKFTNAFSFCIVSSTALPFATAAPIYTTGIARSPQDLNARKPFDFGGLFKALAPIAKPYVAKIPKVGGFLSSFFRRDDGSLDVELLNDFLAAQALAEGNKITARAPGELTDGLITTAFLSELANESNVAARDLYDLHSREPFDWGGLFKAVAPIAKPYVEKIPKIGGFLSQFFRRDGSLDEQLLHSFIVTQALAARSEEFSLLARDLLELDAREPFVIPPGIIDGLIKNAPAIIKAVAPVAKKVVSKVKKFFKKVFRRGEELTRDDVASLIAELITDLEPVVSARDAEAGAAWNELVKAIADAAAA